MKNMLWRSGLLIVVVSAALALVACDGLGPDPVGTITIVSVSPDSGLEDGALYSFTVVVDYTLERGEGEIGVYFNTGDDVSTYIGNPDNNEIVDAGGGRVTLEAQAQAKDWSASGGDFQVLVNLSEYPHASTWSPLASETQVLTLL